jgi:hypothetical protein
VCFELLQVQANVRHERSFALVPQQLQVFAGSTLEAGYGIRLNSDISFFDVEGDQAAPIRSPQEVATRDRDTSDHLLFGNALEIRRGGADSACC